jgi:hypothetical protein
VETGAAPPLTNVSAASTIQPELVRRYFALPSQDE